MMNQIVKIVHDASTGEIVEVPLTEQEIAEREQENEAFIAAQEKEKQDKEAAIAKLQTLGLTLEDLQALGLA